MAQVNYGWLKDYSGIKFLPKTLASQVILDSDNAKNVEGVLTDINNIIIQKPGKLVSTETNAEIFNDLTNNVAAGLYSHAEGYQTNALGDYSHAEGESTEAEGVAHAEGRLTKATGFASHAEGASTEAYGAYSHAEGSHTKANAFYSHAEGFFSEALASAAHAEGHITQAKGAYSHTEGDHTIAGSEAQHVQGRCNIEDTENKYVHIVGNGIIKDKAVFAYSNAHTLDWDGNAWFSGDVYIKSTSGTNKDSGSKKLATEEYVDSHSGSDIILREW